MKSWRLISILGGIGAMAISALSRPTAAATAEMAAGTFTSQSLGGGEWQYDLTLSNASPVNNANTTIGTFWFSWAPGQEYMEADPTNIQAPANWTFLVTGNENPQDGFGIQYVAMSGDLLAAGQSLSGFSFESTETPTQLFGPSTFFQNQIETTSTAYTQGPFSDTTNAGDLFVVTPAGTTTSGGVSAVPLPAASWQILAGLFGVGLMTRVKWMRRRFVGAKS